MQVTQFSMLWKCVYLDVFWLLVIILTHSGSVKTHKKPPNFKPTPRNVTVGPSERAVLKCRIEHLGTKTVTWKRRDTGHPLTIGLFPFVTDTRFSVDFNQRLNEWHLIIQDVKPSDEGTYQCQISTKEDMIRTYDIKLHVRTVQVSGTDYVEKGDPVQLKCNATGKPDPPQDVEWFKNGQRISSNAHSGILITKKIETKVLISVLVIQKSTMEHAGDYICRSSNKDTGMIQVHILNSDTKNTKRGTSIQKITGPENNVGKVRHRKSWLLLGLVFTLTIYKLQSCI